MSYPTFTLTFFDPRQPAEQRVVRDVQGHGSNPDHTIMLERYLNGATPPPPERGVFVRNDRTGKVRQFRIAPPLAEAIRVVHPGPNPISQRPYRITFVLSKDGSSAPQAHCRRIADSADEAADLALNCDIAGCPDPHPGIVFDQPVEQIIVRPDDGEAASYQVAVYDVRRKHRQILYADVGES